MCLGTLTHHMHHDVRKPMIIDPESEDPAVYANPQRTVFHQCELEPQTMRQWFMGSQWPLCLFHSCCIPVGKIRWCSHFRKQKRNFDASGKFVGDEPDGCMYFILEHRHERLDYLGDSQAFPDLDCPATWRKEIEELPRDPDWARFFGRDDDEFRWWRKRQNWDEVFFRAGEKLHTLTEDAEIHFQVYCDVISFWAPEHPFVISAEKNMMRAEERLADQKEVVCDLLDWVEVDCKPSSSISPESSRPGSSSSESSGPESSESPLSGYVSLGVSSSEDEGEDKDEDEDEDEDEDGDEDESL